MNSQLFEAKVNLHVALTSYEPLGVQFKLLVLKVQLYALQML